MLYIICYNQPLALLCSFSKLEKFEESEHILEEALGAVKRLYGEESVEVAGVLTNLGMTYSELGKFQNSRFAILSLRFGSLFSYSILY